MLNLRERTAGNETWEAYKREVRRRARHDPSAKQAKALRAVVENARACAAPPRDFIRAQFALLSSRFCKKAFDRSSPLLAVLSSPGSRVRYRRWAVEQDSFTDTRKHDERAALHVRESAKAAEDMSALAVRLGLSNGTLSPWWAAVAIENGSLSRDLLEDDEDGDVGIAACIEVMEGDRKLTERLTAALNGSTRVAERRTKGKKKKKTAKRRSKVSVLIEGTKRTSDELSLQELEPDDALPKGYLSPSAAGMYLRCPHQFYLRYVEGEKQPPAVALEEGKAHHTWLEINNRAKMKTGDDMTPEQVEEVFCESFVENARAIDAWYDDNEAAVLERGRVMIGTYLDEYAPDVMPVAVEEKAELQIGETPVLMFTDLVTEKKVLDYKTASKKPSEATVKGSVQLALEAAVTKRKDSGFVVLNKKNGSVTEMSVRQTKQTLAWAQIVMRDVGDAVRKGAFPKCAPDSWWCSERFCGFWRMCRGSKNPR